MDPNATYLAYLEHSQDGDYREALDAIEGLMAWIRRGGALPTAMARFTPDGALSFLRMTLADLLPKVRRQRSA